MPKRLITAAFKHLWAPRSHMLQVLKSVTLSPLSHSSDPKLPKPELTASRPFALLLTYAGFLMTQPACSSGFALQFFRVRQLVPSCLLSSADGNGLPPFCESQVTRKNRDLLSAEQFGSFHSPAFLGRDDLPWEPPRHPEVAQAQLTSPSRRQWSCHFPLPRSQS